MNVFQCTLLLAVFAVAVQAYLPVIMYHGIDGSQNDFNPMMANIQKTHPGTINISLPLFDGVGSYDNMQKQVEHVTAYIQNITQNNVDFENGWHLMCHSQGGLVCRGVIENWTGHNINTYISLAGPQMGQYGSDSPVLYNFTTDEAWLVLYTREAQKHFSVAGYWNDPYHQKEYLKHCEFLPYLNNILTSQYSDQFKKNFLALKKVALLGSSGDGVIQPWESTMFSYWDSKGNMVYMPDQQVYTEDTFGLRTMNETGRLVMNFPPGVYHTQWLSNFSLYQTYIEPLLI